MPTTFENHHILVLLNLIEEKSHLLFSRVNNTLTVCNKNSEWQKVHQDFVTATSLNVTLEQLFKK